MLASEQLYTRDYFEHHRGFSLASARVVVPLILQMVSPKRVIDVGCGSGAWAAAFREAPEIELVIGVDGEWISRDLLLFPAKDFVAADLRRPLRLPLEFDLVVSLEVAEHLPPDTAEVYVQTLTSLGPIVLFSAATPDQGGTGHLNEQPLEYWERLFRARGYVLVDSLRRRLAENSAVAWWYAQNIVFFIKEKANVAYRARALRSR